MKTKRWRQMPLWNCWPLQHRCALHCAACICARCIYRRAAHWLAQRFEQTVSSTRKETRT